MCGRFTLTADGEALQLAFGLDDLPALKPRYNVAPSQPVAVITNDAPKSLSLYRWGLVPSWAKEDGGGLINARSETAHEKPSFREAMHHRRCLIPADGYFEWQADGKDKTPQYIFLNDHRLFAFAGLWDVWRNPAGDDVYSCAILTADANERTRHIHHRMPVILDAANYAAWLHGDDMNALRSLLKPYPSDKMDTYPVTRAVNKPANDSPQNIVPAQDDSARQLPLF